ncbi:metalloprotease [Lampropedia cohaerens]|uniref:Metalloprotease n=1 Tax=Lampropedia cohaerens TaxID=1610491 RepID=A0A0U1Q2M5_9BURK|nr:neutral zinc metallopeptidase [Lampropedia cohaerens]KKW69002.1 metalloprotease [Lampropedia cohaerens]
MRWEGNRQSRNLQDRRASRAVGGRGVGIGAILVAVVAGWIFGINPMTVLGLLQGMPGSAPPQSTAVSGPPSDETGQFFATVLADTEDVWNSLYTNYQEPRMVLYRDATQTGCGIGQAEMGPFYCPADQTVYLDERFFDQLARMGATGEFAQAYVVAHEVGHHVQRLQGTTTKLDQLRGRISQQEYNQLSVRLELQADCYAGVWGHHAQRQRQILENGDIEAAMNAAAAVGDDQIQRSAGRTARPETFTHGSSAQRQRWFMRGLQTGDPNACDTFNADPL